jgi:hypothetical protein
MAKVLSVNDICKILEACRIFGVSELSYSGLNLKFHSLGPANVTWPSQAVSHTEASNLVVPENQEAKLMNEQALDDAEEAQMLIDNAFAYERSQIMKDIERNRMING